MRKIDIINDCYRIERKRKKKSMLGKIDSNDKMIFKHMIEIEKEHIDNLDNFEIEKNISNPIKNILLLYIINVMEKIYEKIEIAFNCYRFGDKQKYENLSFGINHISILDFCKNGISLEKEHINILKANKKITRIIKKLLILYIISSH